VVEEIYRFVMQDLGKLLVALGLATTAIGIFVWAGPGRFWLGRLPGDIHFRRGNTEIYFPLGTCILISVVLSLLLWFLRGRR
jgi:hypothetical protein